jgi:hypothetical protein
MLLLGGVGMGSVAAASSLLGTLVALLLQPVLLAMKRIVRSSLTAPKRNWFIEDS